MATLPPALSAGLQAIDPEVRRAIGAYLVWEADGRPEGKGQEYGFRALDPPPQEAPRRKGAHEPRSRVPGKRPTARRGQAVGVGGRSAVK